MIAHFVLLPLVAAFIGWLTNYVAVKMLFHPRKETRLLFVNIQGVFPKRQNELAEKLGEIVATNLLSIEDIKQGLAEHSYSDKVRKLLEEHIDYVLTNKLPQAIPMIAMFFNPQLIQTAKELILGEMKDVISRIVDSAASSEAESLNIRKIVREKVQAYSSDRLEDLIFSIMKKEFTFIELVGGVLGFMIGLIQALIAHYSFFL